MKNLDEILRIVKSIESMLESTKAAPLSVKEASAYLKLTISTIHKMTSAHQIPFYKTGKKIYFLIDDLEAYVFKNRISSIDEIERDISDNITLKGF